MSPPTAAINAASRNSTIASTSKSRDKTSLSLEDEVAENNDHERHNERR
jgi:hypothetical protein